DALEERYASSQYGAFKKDVAEAVVAALTPIREKTEKVLADETQLDQILAYGAARASQVARATMATVRDRVGFIPRLDTNLR
ncbi:MAG TPA: tryptophan--tRNA ligase, partial [Streptosporangiaceae bacterium]|nr:tryptophan--tRNA ligase [Streptosporangiaceae bacterium]